MQEGSTLEFKQVWTDSAKKTIVAFANSEGGTLLVGVADDGRVIGVDDPDQSVVSIMQAVGNAIKPDVTLFTQARIEYVEGKSLVAIEVQRGTARPYYLAEKGIRPAGVYVRQGALSAPASEAAILTMIKESSGDSYEDARSLVQDLTFDNASEAFRTAEVAFEKKHMRSLGLIAEDGMYTNLALLLSDQCPATTKAAVFQGTTKVVFKNRYEFTGSLFRQFRGVMDFVDRYNTTHSEIGSDMRRIDQRDYPAAAVREVMLNMFVHRDYSLAGPALVSIFDDRAEFLNLGGLVPGISEQDMMIGVSLQRNPRLAHVFYRLKWIEAYGTGIPKIRDSYDGDAGVPEFQVTDNAFKVILPSQICSATRAHAHTHESHFDTNYNISGQDLDERAVPRINDDEAKLDPETVVATLAQKGSVSRKEVQMALGVSQSAAVRLMTRMVDEGVLQKRGRGKNTRYVIASC